MNSTYKCAACVLGLAYNVGIEYIVTPTGSEEEVTSSPLNGVFTTKPLPPTNLKVGPGNHELTWTLSPTQSVR